MMEELVDNNVNNNSEVDITSEGPTYIESQVVDSPSNNKGKKRKKKEKSKARKIVEWILTGLFAAIFVVFAVGKIMAMVQRNEHYGQDISFGLASFVVKTDSMEPTYPVDTAIITYLESEDKIVNTYKNGATITPYERNGLIGVSIINEDVIIDITFFNNYTNSNIYPSVTSEDGTHFTRQVTANMAMTHRIFEIIQIENDDGTVTNYFITAGINDESTSYSGEQYQVSDYQHILGVVKVNSPFLGGFFKILTSPWGLLIFLLIPALYLAITSIIDIVRALNDAEETPSEVKKTSNSPLKDASSLEGLSEKDKERLKKEMLEEMLNKRKDDK